MNHNLKFKRILRNMISSLSGEQFEGFASVILRVPGIFILDYWWSSSNSISKSLPESMEWTDIVGALLTTLVPLQGLLLLLLPLEKLVTLYMHYIAASLLVVAHLFSSHYVSVEQKDTGWMSRYSAAAAVVNTTNDPQFLRRQIAALIIHVAIASIVCFLLDLNHQVQRVVLAAYTLPVVAKLSNFPTTEIHIVHNFVSAFMIIQVLYYTIKHVPTVAFSFKNLMNRLLTAIEYYGWLGVSFALWKTLFVPVHLFLFWVVQIISHAYYYKYRAEVSEEYDEWYLILLTCTSEICGSPISLLSTSVAVAYLSYYLLTTTKFFLQGYNAFISDNLVHSGWTEGLTLILLSLQTGMLELKMPHRAAVMSIILFIVLSSLIQSMFEITEPFLLALSASHNKSIIKHTRTLGLCCFLFVFPLYMTSMLCRIFQIDFWMLVVISSCIMTSVQVLGLVAIYVLFMYDAFRKEPWESLDDVVYYTRSGTRVMEFMVAVFVVGAGLRESMMGQWSWINSSILIIHCYFNVWQRLQSGWKSFLLRREAAIKIESLPMASESDLDAYGDVCAICYTEMKTARVTACKHYYHAACLRKWLYVQNSCPMCHKTFTPAATPTTTQQEAEQNDGTNNPNNN